MIMTEYIAYYVTDSGYVSVWEQPSVNFEDDVNVFETLNVSTLADVVTALGDAGYIVVSDWSDTTSFLVRKAKVERIAEWDARNGVVSRTESKLAFPQLDGNLVIYQTERLFADNVRVLDSYASRQDQDESDANAYAESEDPAYRD